MTRSWDGPEQLEELFWSTEVVRIPDGLTLSDHCVIADENGDVVEQFMGYADTAFEEITAATWARKMFDVPDPRIGDAVICVAGHKLRGRGKLAGAFNGVPFTWPARINCTPWYSDWVLIPAPAPLRKGANELILHTTGTLAWRLFIAPSMFPNRSARSADAGRTWDDEHLGLGGFIDGEYCIRISGTRLAASGAITSPPIQFVPGSVAGLAGAGRFHVPPAGRVASLDVRTNCASRVEVRLGTGPWLDRPGIWTRWRKLSASAAKALERELPEPGPRFVQFRITLTPGQRSAPVLKRVRLIAELRSAANVAPLLVEIDKPPTVLSGRPFAHQRPSDKLVYLRKKYRLDQIFNAGRDEWDGLLRLAAWVGNYCGHRVKRVDLIPRPVYEVHNILELGHAKRTPVYCGGLAFALVQLGAAFGLTGRVICRGNHLVTEFWSPVHGKWAVVDPMDQRRDPKTGEIKVWTEGFGGYYHAGNGLPMSAIDLGAARGNIIRRHFVWKSGLYRTRPATVARDLRWFRREISYPERNNYTDATEPLFRADVFRYSGHLKYRRPGQAVMPWYPKFTSRRGDVEWTVGETSVFLTALPDGQVLVQLRSQLPNAAAFDVCPEGRIDTDTCMWDTNGAATLAVRAVNTLDQPGPETLFTVQS